MISLQLNPKELPQSDTATKLIFQKETLLHPNRVDILYRHNLKTMEKMERLWVLEEIQLKLTICFTEV